MTGARAPNTGDPVISLRDVSVSYGSRRVLERVGLGAAHLVISRAGASSVTELPTRSS